MTVISGNKDLSEGAPVFRDDGDFWDSRVAGERHQHRSRVVGIERLRVR